MIDRNMGEFGTDVRLKLHGGRRRGKEVGERDKALLRHLLGKRTTRRVHEEPKLRRAEVLVLRLHHAPVGERDGGRAGRAAALIPRVLRVDVQPTGAVHLHPRAIQ